MCFYRQETELGLTWASVLSDCIKILPQLSCTNIQVLGSIPEVMKSWVFRGQHELFRKKPKTHTPRLETQASNYFVLIVSFQNCGFHFHKIRFCTGFGFFPAQLLRECTCSRCHVVGTSPCWPLISLHSLLNFCVAGCACLRFADQWKSWGTEAGEIAMTPQTSSTLFKIWPCILLPSLSLAAKAALQSWTKSFKWSKYIFTPVSF